MSSDRSATFKQMFDDQPLWRSGFVDGPSPLVERQSTPVEARLTAPLIRVTGSPLNPEKVGDL
ncbi:hypothetical protein [Phenylobacterium sp.]|uniref:hypothetical protein n=1 Tax=Phenylobacterium sp. TaxID=1871053 RepID=UPI0025DE6FA4|nr:hypothetical protein [Phenylobacterium sp.]